MPTMKIPFKSGKARCYWDTAAATPLAPVVGKMMDKAVKDFGNPSSIHREGVLAQTKLSEARKTIASLIAAEPDEIIFTGGGTEGDNLAIQGIARAYGKPGQVITTKIEHKAVLEPCRYLESVGHKVAYLPVLSNGLVDPKELEKVLTMETFLVSIVYANNEIGTIQPIKEIAKIIRRWRKEKKTNLPYLHIDACQAPRFLSLNVLQLGVDLMTINGSKIYGPKGVGFLYVKRGVALSPLLLGGGQEAGRRSGTHNVPAIVGLAGALEICEAEKEKEIKKLIVVRDYLTTELKKIPGLKLNGGFGEGERLPNNINFSVEDLEGEQLVLELDARGFAVSSGSACSFGGNNGSYVVVALGCDKARAISAVRISLPREASLADAKKFIKSLGRIVKKYKIAQNAKFKAQSWKIEIAQNAKFKTQNSKPVILSKSLILKSHL